MPPRPHPSTWSPSPAGLSIAPPHAESHEAGGSDPVLGPIRYLGSFSASGTIPKNTATTATSFDLDVQTRGGQLLVMFGGSRFLDWDDTALFVNTIEADWSLYVDGSISGSVQADNFVVLNDAEPTQVSLTNSSTITWLVDGVSSGLHNLTIYVATSAQTRVTLTNTYMVVFELLPTRRD